MARGPLIGWATMDGWLALLLLLSWWMGSGTP